MKNNLNSLWGTELEELGYSKITAVILKKNRKTIFSVSMINEFFS